MNERDCSPLWLPSNNYLPFRQMGTMAFPLSQPPALFRKDILRPVSPPPLTLVCLLVDLKFQGPSYVLGLEVRGMGVQLCEQVKLAHTSTAVQNKDVGIN